MKYAILLPLFLLAVASASGLGAKETKNVSTKEQVAIEQQAVIVHFQYESTDLSGLFALEDQLKKVLSGGTLGKYDRSELADDGSNGILYLSGPDATRLFNAVENTLRGAPFMKNASVELRLGPPTKGVKEQKLQL